uniref:Cyclin A n=1 Tax=Timema shepardi TaxID=629360 RepID=A0A7R9AQU7_TIMSH|nr:unnamed protein product [Timema shepardi]
MNLDLPVNGSPVFCKSDVLDHAAITDVEKLVAKCTDLFPGTIEKLVAKCTNLFPGTVEKLVAKCTKPFPRHSRETSCQVYNPFPRHSRETSCLVYKPFPQHSRETSCPVYKPSPPRHSRETSCPVYKPFLLAQPRNHLSKVLGKRDQGISKQKQSNSQDENKWVSKKNVQPPQATFSIYEDEPEDEIPVVVHKITQQPPPLAECDVKLKGLPGDVSGLHRVPLQEMALVPHASTNILPESPMVLDKTLSESGSPMILDKSLKETQVEKEKTFQSHLIDMEEYREEVYKYLRKVETRHRGKPRYMLKQPDISYSMRAILVDWLVEVAEEYRLQTETLYLSVSYIDRFLSYMSVMRAKLQLVGTAAMFIASKYEEIFPPDINEFVYITDDTYTKKQVLRMEHLILKVLSFDLSVPTTLSFITSYCSLCPVSDTVLYLAMYISELSLLEADPYMGFLPSEKAASALALARFEQELEPWTQELEDASGYKLDQLKMCMQELRRTYCNAPNLPQKAIQDKYKEHRWLLY